MQINSIDKIYVCHHAPLVERMIDMSEQLKSYELDAEFVTDYAPSDINVDDLSLVYMNIKGIIPAYMRRLSINEISLILKHFKIWREFDLDDSLNSILVLEDDVKFSPNFIEQINKYISSDTVYDFISVGSCCSLTEKGVGLVSTNRGSRCTHAYMISRACYYKIKEDLCNIQEPIDFYINKVVLKYNLSNFWLEPSVAIQNEKYKTSIIR